MKKLFCCITVILSILLCVILLSGCNSTTPPISKIETLEFTDANTSIVNQTFDLGSIKLTIKEIQLLHEEKNEKFDAIEIIGKISCDSDNIYWSPENSYIIINDDERSVPLLISTGLNNPINKIDDQDIELMAFVTKTKLNNINRIYWHIEEPNIRNNVNSFSSAGSELNVTYNIKGTN